VITLHQVICVNPSASAILHPHCGCKILRLCICLDEVLAVANETICQDFVQAAKRMSSRSCVVLLCNPHSGADCQDKVLVVWGLGGGHLHSTMSSAQRYGIVCNCVDVVESRADDVVKALLSTTSTQIQRHSTTLKQSGAMPAQSPGT
jgi:hypothetical protein